MCSVILYLFVCTYRGIYIFILIQFNIEIYYYVNNTVILDIKYIIYWILWLRIFLCVTLKQAIDYKLIKEDYMYWFFQTMLGYILLYYMLKKSVL